MCIENSNIWIICLIRICMIIICTPSSIILEWTSLRLYKYYLNIFQNKILQVLSYGSPVPNRESLLSSYLGRGYLGHTQLSEWKTSVLHYTSVIETLLHQATVHNFVAIDNGSIVERFGLPLGNNSLLEELKTDHDVMFVPKDILVSEQTGCSVFMVTKHPLIEYVNLQSRCLDCHLLGNIAGEEQKIDNTKAKTLLDTVVTNVSMKDFQMKSPTPKLSALLGLFMSDNN